MNERLLLRLPHRQMVFTFPKVLRGFFRYHRTLYGEIARRVYAMISTFYNATAGCRLHSAAVIAYASAGEFARFNPHLHAIVLEGGFDPSGRFVHLPRLDLCRLSQHFRTCMVDFFFKCQLINARYASPQALREPVRLCRNTSPGHRCRSASSSCHPDL
jgi:hypothetical protein